ncbi:hypothetical protein ACFPOA_03715 [Lysobacter niabensis]|uniref:hypothetical protein n=1 Tax=Agrilutibacter niabensis TaxID=380628 RepID=UPI003616D757
MNVFVLCTGRCGSVTFARAARHIRNYRVGHETRMKQPGPQRVDYPADHIEIDNRLSWFLGRLDAAYGNNAIYVHLRRDPEAVASSFNRRWHLGGSIMRAYADQVYAAPVRDPLAFCRDYVDTVTANINLFLRDKSHKMDFWMEHSATDWPAFWSLINAEGKLEDGLSEWAVAHNASP